MAETTPPAPQPIPSLGQDVNGQRAAWLAAHTPSPQKVDLGRDQTNTGITVMWSAADLGLTHSPQPEAKSPKAVALDAAFAHPELGHEPVRAAQVQAIPKDGAAIQTPAQHK